MTTWLGLLTVLIAILSYSFYFRDMFKGKTKPHTLTWLIWGLLNTFIFMQQLTHGAGPGAWVTAVAGFANLLIFVFSFKYGERRITIIDWICLIGAAILLVLWLQTSDATLSVMLASLIFVVGFIPTIRKAWSKAHEETAITFALNSLKFFIALFALGSVSIVTAFYPAVLFVLNGAFAIFLIVKRGGRRTIRGKKKGRR